MTEVKNQNYYALKNFKLIFWDLMANVKYEYPIELLPQLYAPCRCTLFKHPTMSRTTGVCVPVPLHSVIKHTVCWHSTAICKTWCLTEEGVSKEANLWQWFISRPEVPSFWVIFFYIKYYFPSYKLSSSFPHHIPVIMNVKDRSPKLTPWIYQIVLKQKTTQRGIAHSSGTVLLRD